MATAAGIIFDKDSTNSTPRSDHTGFTYDTRSYGIGSSVGLSLPTTGEGTTAASGYTYNEIGYDTSVYCQVNSSSQWTVTLIAPVTDQNASLYVPNIYLCSGSTSDDVLDWYLQYSLVNDSNIVALESHVDHSSINGGGIVAIATGQDQGNKNYKILNNIQCSVVFTPTLFQVSVNLTTRSITVTNLSSAADMDPTASTNATFEAWNCDSVPNFIDSVAEFDTPSGECGPYTVRGQSGMGNIATRTLRQLVDLSKMDSSLYKSNLGDMFLTDVSDEQKYEGDQPDSSTSNIDITYSVEQAVRSIIDDTLLAFASAQIMIPKSTTEVSGIITVQNIQFGTKIYVFSLFIFNTVLVLMLLHELLRTRVWQHLPQFNYNDVKSVIVASSIGGNVLGDEVISKHKTSGTFWVANAKDKIAGEVHVQLRHDEKTGVPDLVLADISERADHTEESPWLMANAGGSLYSSSKQPYLVVTQRETDGMSSYSSLPQSQEESNG